MKLRYIFPKSAILLAIFANVCQCETTLYLSKMGKNVTIVEMLSDIALGMETLSKNYLLREIKESNIIVMVNSPVKEIKEHYVVIGDGKEIQADYFAIAFGGKLNHKLCNKMRRKYESYLIGDAINARKIIDAVREGYTIAKTI